MDVLADALYPQRRFQSFNIARLCPASVGASYAGGILSAAVDGIKVAEALAVNLGAR